MSLETIYKTLGGRKMGNNYMCHCPCTNNHKNGDKHPSLHLEQKDGKILVHCHRGCSHEEVILALKERGLWKRNTERQPEAVYKYVDEYSQLVFEKVRYPGKEFRLRRKSVDQKYIWNLNGIEKKPLFRLPKILEAIKKGTPIIFTEGEKDVQTFERLGYTAFTNFDGAGDSKWKAHYSEYLRDADLILAGDNDVAGLKFQSDIALAVQKTTHSLRQIFIPEQFNGKPTKDISDLFGAGATKDEIAKLVANAEDLKLKALVPEVSIQSTDWPEIIPLKDDLLPVEALPEAILPSPFRDYLLDVAKRMSCPIEFPAIAMMVMAGSVIGTRCTISPKQHDNWQVYPNIWGAVVSPPGAMKSAALNSGLLPLNKLENIASENYERIQGEQEGKRRAHEIQIKALEGKLKQAIEKNNLLDVESLQQELEHLGSFKGVSPKRYLTQDSSIEKVSEILRDNPTGILIYRDELVGLFKTWDQKGHENDRTFYLEAWNGGGTYTVDRISRGTVSVKNLCLSVLGGIQADKLSSYLYSTIRGNQNDGLIQRFQLIVYPDSKTYAWVDEAPDHFAQDRAFSCIQKLEALDFTQLGARKDFDEQTPYFRFDKDAQELFIEWIERHENKIKLEEEPVIKEHLTKYRKLMPALALIIHILELVDGKPTSQIPTDCVLQADGWCGFLEQHARRIYGLILNGRSPALELYKKIKSGKLTNPFRIRDVYRKEWSLLGDRESAESAVSILVKANICIPVSNELYQIHPQLIS